MKRIAALAVVFTLLCCCAPADSPLPTASFFAMNTTMSIQLDGDEALLRGAENVVCSLERKLSVTDPSSELFAINSRGEGEVSPDTAELLKFALDICEKTDGALDISIYPVLRAWGFTTDGDYRVPDGDELADLLALVDYTKVDVSEGTVTLAEGMQLDLGAVGKGFAGDRVVEYLRENGVKSALLNLGGNVQALGSKPNGSPWTVAVADPLNGGYLGTLEVSDRAVVTSGGYERRFELDGATYHHIIDPSDGRPAASGLVSVTVVAEDGVLCDALSTAFFVMGLDRASEYWRAHGGFEAIFLTDDGGLYVTSGLEGSFTAQGSYGAALTVIR